MRQRGPGPRLPQALDNRNIYYDLNKLGEGCVDAVHYFHVDINPARAEDLEAAQKRLHRLALVPPNTVPAPTACIYSGGGYQLLWALQTPIEVGGEVSIVEEVKRYNLALQQAYEAPDCHNVDRIMRLAGTINWPGIRKRERGQEAVRAKLEWFHASCRYALSLFKQASIIQTKTSTGFGSVRG